jgi:hypothetical protein
MIPVTMIPVTPQVLEVIRIAEQELRGLLQRRAAITRRMTALRRMLSGLEELFGSSILDEELSAQGRSRSIQPPEGPHASMPLGPSGSAYSLACRAGLERIATTVPGNGPPERTSSAQADQLAEGTRTPGAELGLEEALLPARRAHRPRGLRAKLGLALVGLAHGF